MAYIVVREPGHVTTSVALRDGFQVGRGEENDLVLADRQVSRRHAAFACTEGGYAVKDMGSTHGVLVNGNKVESVELSDRDSIQVGNVLFTFVDENEPHEILHSRATLTGHLEIDALMGDTRRLRLFYEVSGAIGSLDDTDELIENMLDAIVEVLGCERGVLALSEAARGGPMRIARGRREAGSPEEVVISGQMLDRMTKNREGVIVRNEGGATPETLVAQNILCAMGVPLCTSDGVVLGYVYVDDRGRKDRFSVEDLDFLNALAHLTSVALQSAAQYQRMASTAATLRESRGDDGIIGASPVMQALRGEIRKYAAAGDANALINGESGTGKELVARCLHGLSPRREEPFVAVNCAALPDTMVESEFFGHVKGAFTDAASDKRGKFVLANHGTLFLDEVGDLSLAAQAKLLRAIEEGEIQPLGREELVRVDVRCIAATNKDLGEEVAAKRFREDLFYRLDVVHIAVPPLRERGDDVALLAKAFLERANARVGKRLRGFAEGSLDALRRYGWPGNVRELQNEIERAVIVADGEWINVGHLSARVLEVRPVEEAVGRSLTLAQRFAGLETTERALIEEAITQAKGNVSKAARLLGITRIMAKRRMERYGIS